MTFNPIKKNNNKTKKEMPQSLLPSLKELSRERDGLKYDDVMTHEETTEPYLGHRAHEAGQEPDGECTQVKK